MADSLCWSHTRSCWEDFGTPRRRPEFPSWSWAGWAGEVGYRKRDYLGKSWFTGLLRTVALEDQSGILTTLESPFDSIPKHKNPLPRVLRVEASLVPPRLFSYHKRLGSAWNQWTVLDFRAHLLMSRGPDSETRFYEELKEGCLWKCILVGVSIDTVFIMVLETHIDTDITSRAGLFIVDYSYRKLARVLDDSTLRTYRIN